MEFKKHNSSWIIKEEATLNKQDLKEGQLYLLPYLNQNGTVLVNHCVYAVINGQIVIHRSANWEDIPISNVSKKLFLLEPDKTLAQLPADISCFIDLEKLVDQ